MQRYFLVIEILPHERILLESKIEEGVRENLLVADVMANAIENGNAWHDNAEYDEAVNRMKLIDSRFTPIFNLLNESEVVDFPDFDESKVVLGSLTRLKQYGETYSALLVGQLNVGEDLYYKIWKSNPKRDEDLEIVSAQSPMGFALKGSNVGDDVTYKVDNLEISIFVVDIDQAWIQNASKLIMSAS